MTEPAITIDPRDTRRVRASERAFRIALKVMQDAGLPVGKVCITGSQIEIHCGSVEAAPEAENDRRLKQW